MSKIAIRGHEFDFDLYDLDTMELYTAAEAELYEVTGGADIANSPSVETLTTVFKALSAYFDKMLGEGSLMQILDGKRNIMDALDAYYELRDMAIESNLGRAAEVARRAAIPDKYKLKKIRK